MQRQPLSVNHRITEKFRKSGRDFNSLDKKGLIHIFFLVKDKCGWETYKKFFKYYQDEVPNTLSPDTNENTYSTTAKSFLRCVTLSHFSSGGTGQL